MQKYQNNVQNVAGNAVAGASVRVLTYPAGVVAAIYSDDGVTPEANPMTTDSLGAFAFYAADGRYSLEITGQGFVSQTLTDIAIADPFNSNTVDKFVAGVGFVPGVTTQLTLSVTPTGPDQVSIFFDPIYQMQDQWSLSGNVVTFTSPIPVGISRVEVRTST